MNRSTFFAALRKRGSGVFGTSLKQTQVDGLERLLSATSSRPISHVAYLLATAFHETGGNMQPIREAFGKSDGDTINRLEKAWKAGRLGQVRTPYWRPDASGKSWFGRGYVQLTHRDNYARAAAVTGVDLLGDPSKAMHPEVAAKILVEGCESGLFTGKRLSDYLPGDPVNARRVVNGTDKAALIAGYAKAFEAALREAGYSVTAKTPVKDIAFTVPGQVKTPGTGAVVVGGGLLAGLGAALWKWGCDIAPWLFSNCGG